MNVQERPIDNDLCNYQSIQLPIQNKHWQKTKWKIKLCTELFEIELFICIKMDLALNDLQWLICYKSKPNQTKWKIW